MKTDYYQLVGDEKLVVTVQTKELRFSRDIVNDELIGPVEKSLIVTLWESGRYYLIPLTLMLPPLIYPMSIISKAWVTSLFGLLACCLPSGGAPIAGGIVFIPCLQFVGLTAKQSVAFCSITQTFGCGIFAPMNWYAKDPGIFLRGALLVCVPAGVLGLLMALFVCPLDDALVKPFFAWFCIFLACTVVYGLHHDLTTQDEPVTFSWPTTWSSLRTWFLYIGGSFLGGMIAGWIGIGIEKIFFLLATSYHKAELRRATITAIFIIGILSSFSAVMHIFLLHDIPYPYWLCSLPGLIVGSIIGPKVNAFLGSRNVMIVFCSFLVANAVYEFYQEYHH